MFTFHRQTFLTLKELPLFGILEEGSAGQSYYTWVGEHICVLDKLNQCDQRSSQQTEILRDHNLECVISNFYMLRFTHF